MSSFTIGATGTFGPVRGSTNMNWFLNNLGAGDTVEVRISYDGGTTQETLQTVIAATPTKNGQVLNNLGDVELLFNVTAYGGSPYNASIWAS